MQPLLIALLAMHPGFANLAGPTQVLVVDRHIGKAKSGQFVDMADEMAEEIDNAGKLSPIVWSLGDPILRAAVADGLVKSPKDNPSDDQLEEVRQKLKIRMTLVLSAREENDQVFGEATLFQGDKKLWEDKKQMSAQLNGRFDRSTTIHSMARTWASIIGENPLKEVPAAPIKTTPTPDPALTPKAPDVAPVKVPEKVSNQALFDQVARDYDAGRVDAAIALLRDAVDAAPSDLERREHLISLLMKAKKPELAAIEARRASELYPDAAQFRMLAAKAWVAAGKPDEAEKDLNGLMASSGGDVGAREMLGEAALLRMKPDEAVDHFSSALKDHPTPDGYLYRALARCIEGDSGGAQSDFAKATPLSPDRMEARYSFCGPVIDKALARLVDEVRPLAQAAAVDKGASLSADVLKSKLVKAQLLGVFLETISPPVKHHKSHDRRVLAANLIGQVVRALDSYAKSKDDDDLLDARVNLGEASKQIASAGDLWKDEAAG